MILMKLMRGAESKLWSLWRLHLVVLLEKEELQGMNVRYSRCGKTNVCEWLYLHMLVSALFKSLLDGQYSHTALPHIFLVQNAPVQTLHHHQMIVYRPPQLSSSPVWGQSLVLTTELHTVQQPRKWDGCSAEHGITSLQHKLFRPVTMKQRLLF